MRAHGGEHDVSMLPRYSGNLRLWLSQFFFVLVWCKRAADMTEQVIRCLGKGFKVRFGISQQGFKVFPTMVVRDDAARDTSEPLNAIGIRVIGGRVGEREPIRAFGQHIPHEQGSLGRVGLKIIRNDNGHLPARHRTSYNDLYLCTKDIGGPFRCYPAIKSTISPVHQPLPIPTTEASDPRERWMKSKLHLIQQVEICVRQQLEEFREFGRKLLSRISVE